MNRRRRSGKAPAARSRSELLQLFDPQQKVLVKPFPERGNFVPQAAPNFFLPRRQVNGSNFRNFARHGHLTTDGPHTPILSAIRSPIRVKNLFLISMISISWRSDLMGLAKLCPPRVIYYLQCVRKQTPYSKRRRPYLLKQATFLPPIPDAFCTFAQTE